MGTIHLTGPMFSFPFHRNYYHNICQWLKLGVMAFSGQAQYLASQRISVPGSLLNILYSYVYKTY